MYRVVLIDDEKIIVDGLTRVIKWADYNCEVVGAAYDAAGGAALIRRLKPHIVFTDIKMPDQDGLTMLAGLKSEFPEMQIAVLTGYRDFNYAQEAIKLGVTRFLLKPSKMDELHEALSAMKEKLDKLPPDAAAGEDEPCLDRHAGSFIVNQATAYIEEHYAQKLTLQEVADKCYVSQWHLSKLINKYTGNTFYELLNNVRIEKAKALLNDPKLKIGDIVDMVGYSDAAHFSRVFKRIVGVSANEYRNSSAVK
ncbi:MAG: response regulator [Eubacteriales bacterium]|nr:response regulator [Eubacteriales bacterium]